MRTLVSKVLYRIGKIIQFMHLLRVQLFIALLILLPIPIGALMHAGTFVGLSDAIWFYSLVAITMALFLLAWTLHITTRLVLIYGPPRYGIADVTMPLPNPTLCESWLHSPWFTLVLSAVLPIPTLIALWCNTGHLGSLGKGAAMALGFILAAGFLVLAANMHDRVESQGGGTAEQMYPRGLLINPGGGRVPGGRLHFRAGIDYASSNPKMAGLLQNGQLRSGHQMAFIFLAFFLLVYVFFFFEGLAVKFYSPHMPAALLFVYLLVIWVTWILSGLTFTLDRYHVPILSTLLLLSLAFSAAFPKDHEFRVFSERPNAYSPLTPAQVVGAWEKIHPSTSNVPIVIIAAEGGAIEASAWTNLVLNKLETATANRLHDSVVLLSSVSGGSTGAYYYLDQFKPEDVGHSTFGGNALQASKASSLSADGWGFAYPDFARIVPFVGWFVPAHSDRGYTLEQAWRRNSGSTASMRDWINDTSRGVRPAVIFNATGSETGQPVLFGTTRLSASLPLFAGSNDRQLEQQFLVEFFKSDLAVSTAARMSASFPYVSPEARPAKSLVNDYQNVQPLDQTTNEPPKKWWDGMRIHVGDGGLFDNSGVVSAIHWIYDLSRDPTAPHHPVVLLMITSPYHPESGSNWSWQHQLIGPVETMLHVRTGSQHLRRNLEAQLLTELSDKVAKTNGAASLDRLSTGQTGSSEKPFPAVTILRFCNSTDENLQTLSWHLTTSQEEALGSTWDREYGNPKAPTHAEVATLMHLLDPSEPDVPPSNTCPEPN